MYIPQPQPKAKKTERLPENKKSIIRYFFSIFIVIKFTQLVEEQQIHDCKIIRLLLSKLQVFIVCEEFQS